MNIFKQNQNAKTLQPDTGLSLIEKIIKKENEKKEIEKKINKMKKEQKSKRQKHDTKVNDKIKYEINIKKSIENTLEKLNKKLTHKERKQLKQIMEDQLTPEEKETRLQKRKQNIERKEKEELRQAEQELKDIEYEIKVNTNHINNINRDEKRNVANTSNLAIFQKRLNYYIKKKEEAEKNLQNLKDLNEFKSSNKIASDVLIEYSENSKTPENILNSQEFEKLFENPTRSLNLNLNNVVHSIESNSFFYKPKSKNILETQELEEPEKYLEISTQPGTPEIENQNMPDSKNSGNLEDLEDLKELEELENFLKVSRKPQKNLNMPDSKNSGNLEDLEDLKELGLLLDGAFEEVDKKTKQQNTSKNIFNY